ncbi:MAG: DUF4388 domain-containing protein [Chloroflexales bacterium]|nr:DUF4388 domain-containing protein [Chloroflexales bacterium]
MNLEGSLQQFPLQELIEMIAYSSVTGVLKIFGSPDYGQIYCRNGNPYHAIYGDLTGLDAVSAIFESAATTFSFVDSITNEAESLWGDPFELADQARRLAVRWREVRSQISDLNRIPRQLVTLEQAHNCISPIQREYFAAIDGQHTIAELTKSLACEAIDLCETVAQMNEDGLIELRTPNPIVAKEDPPPVAISSSPHGGGLFDKLLATLPPQRPAESQSQTTARTEPESAVNGHSSDSHANPEEDILRLLRA